MEKRILETVEHNTVQLGRIAFALEEKENYRTGEVTQLRRIADSLDEILRLVKADQEQYKKKPKKNGRVESWDEKN